jgi:hypothetical protein
MNFMSMIIKFWKFLFFQGQDKLHFDEEGLIIISTLDLTQALLLNINNNFLSVSFNIAKSNLIEILIILVEKTEIEEELINDFIIEYCALQDNGDCYESLEIIVNSNITPYKYIVFAKKI